MKNYIFDAFNDNVIDLKPIFFNESRKDTIFVINIFGDFKVLFTFRLPLEVLL